MYISKYIALIVILELSVIQEVSHAQTKDTCLCERSWCRLAKDDAAHFNPYYNGHLCENFCRWQTDFSKEYYSLMTRSKTGVTNDTEQFKTFYCNEVWLSRETEANGVLGLDYKRIRFHIFRSKKDRSDHLCFHLEGKSNVGGIITPYNGELHIIAAYLGDTTENGNKISYHIFYFYILREDSTKKHSGFFKGAGDAFVQTTRYKSFKNHSSSDYYSANLDETDAEGDGYYNRTFVGTWTNYRTHESKKCIWGDDRLPFTFDFDQGDGEMHVSDKYANNGWQEFNKHSEYTFIGDERFLKDRWWLRN